MLRGLLPLAAALPLGTSLAFAGTPALCENGGAWPARTGRAPPAVSAYLQTLGKTPFNLRSACAHWAGTFSPRHLASADDPARSNAPPPRFILFPAKPQSARKFADWLNFTGYVRYIERAGQFFVVTFSRYTPTARLVEILDAPQVEYAEPDCDGPDFLTTALDANFPAAGSLRCWQQSARDSFPNDPCMEELWGHKKIGWDSVIAARSLPRVVAVLDSGIDASHADLAQNVLRIAHIEAPRSTSGRLNAKCATSGRCYPHGTEMAGTISGRMDNGIGVVGVAPNSRLLPIVISRIDRGLLDRISTIARGIQAAAADDVDIINISAKWPVDSRAISEAVRAAVGGAESRRRLLVTGYTTALDRDDTVREYYPSLYRCLPGVISAVPADMRGRDLFNPGKPPNANDGRIQAPGVDIVVTTTENSERGYALSGAAGASSAAAYVSGAVALIWGSPPLNTCDAQQIKQLLFCRSKSSNSTRYPWVHVDFLRELSKVDPGASCSAAMDSLGCS